MASEDILIEERERKERRILQCFENNLHSFVISLESLLQSVNPILEVEDILCGLSCKEFSWTIHDLHGVKWVLILKLSNQGKSHGSWPYLYNVEQNFVIGYSLAIECSFDGGKLYWDFNHGTKGQVSISNLVEKIIREHNGFEMANESYRFPAFQKEVYDFFRELLLHKTTPDIVNYVFRNSQKIYYLILQFGLIYKQFLSNHNAVRAFQCLVFETAGDLKETKNFVKSKKLEQIRESLENRSKQIVAKINQ
ncbi:MAG TPA: hypothetical protein VJC06_01755 [Candidatus Paceibacterota bacterium]